MACNKYQFYYGTSGVLSASYLLCGDLTPVTLTDSGGVSGSPYLSGGLVGGAGPGIVIAVTGSVRTYVGNAVAGDAIPGYSYTYNYAPWAQFVNTAATSALSSIG